MRLHTASSIRFMVLAVLPLFLGSCVDAGHCSSSSEHACSGMIDQHCTDVMAVAVLGAFILIAAIWKAIADHC